MDTAQDELLIANAAMVVLSVFIGLIGYLGGIFGMNLDNWTVLQPISTEYHMFKTVCCVTAALLVVGFPSTWFYFIWTGAVPTRVRSYTRYMRSKK